MVIELGNIITISYVERCDGIVFATNIEEVARDNNLYSEKVKYIPTIICVGKDSFAKGLHDEFVGKEVGTKGTVLVPVEKAYGERSTDKIHSIDKKEFEKDVKVGSYIRHPDYGSGLVVNKIGPKFIVDFNETLAGRDIEYDYEIHEIVTDPAEQLSRLINRLVTGEFNVSFENGTGIIDVTIPLVSMEQWNQLKATLIWELLGRLSDLEIIEFREKYENIFNMKPAEAPEFANEEKTESEEFHSESVESSVETVDSDSNSNSS